MNVSLKVSSFIILLLASCTQQGKTASVGGSLDALKDVDTKLEATADRQSIPLNFEQYIYTDTSYQTSTGKGITIQNSLPKGGSIAPEGTQYVDGSGERHAFAVFWTRITNETDFLLQLNIDFPADSATIFTPPGSYAKFFLPPNEMTYDKLGSFNYRAKQRCMLILRAEVGQLPPWNGWRA